MGAQPAEEGICFPLLPLDRGLTQRNAAGSARSIAGSTGRVVSHVGRGGRGASGGESGLKDSRAERDGLERSYSRVAGSPAGEVNIKDEELKRLKDKRGRKVASPRWASAKVGKSKGEKVLTFTHSVTLPSASPQAVSAPL